MNKNIFLHKVAIVTGGGTGIGRATSLALAASGARVVVSYSRSATEAHETVAAIREQDGEAIAILADLAEPTTIATMIQQTVEAFGGIDYVVNNAGATRQLPFADLELATDEVWDFLLDINVKGTFRVCQAAAPHLRKRSGSAIVNVGSIAGETGHGSSLPYAVSKAAVHGLTRSLARALAPAVRVNCIAPGAVDTRWWKGHEEKMRALSGHLPLQRISTPEDIAQSVLMLLAAESMTGQIIRAENGQTL